MASGLLRELVWSANPQPPTSVNLVHARYLPNPNVLFQRFADGAVIYTPSNETYLGLNETGARLWSMLPPDGLGFDELLERAAAAYPEAPVNELRRDLADWLQEMSEQGLARAVTDRAA